MEGSECHSAQRDVTAELYAVGTDEANRREQRIAPFPPDVAIAAAKCELGRRVEVYGNLATAWSSYDGRTATGSFHERGINSFQLVKVDGKWLVASILWQEESAEFPLPADMITGSKKK